MAVLSSWTLLRFVRIVYVRQQQQPTRPGSCVRLREQHVWPYRIKPSPQLHNDTGRKRRQAYSQCLHIHTFRNGALHTYMSQQVGHGLL